MTTEPRSARDVLADVVVELVVFCDLADEHEVHPDTSVRLLEGTLAALDELRASDRLWLIERVRTLAAAEAHPDRKRALERLAGQLLEEAA